MRTLDKPDKSTREKLLASACEVFQTKGFRNATIAEICERAGANVALVNYYFGDKEKLYLEVLKFTYAALQERHPESLTPHPDRPPEEQLYLFVLGRVRCIFSEEADGIFPKLMVKEMAEPTPALSAIVEEAIRPQAEILHDIVRAISEIQDEQQLQLGVMSVISQCLHLAFSEPIRQQLFGDCGHNEALVEQIARHITRFSIAGIRAMKDN